MSLIEPVPVPALADLGRVHFIAIGGAGMSGVAEGCLARGLTVSGCDQVDSPLLADLAAQGATVHVGHDPAHLAGIDTVVVSSAIRDTNPERVAAERLGLPVLHRSVALAALMEQQTVIAVAGTHGKTTTTAMCVAALQGAGQDPSYVVGGTVLGSGTGALVTDGPWFVVEADESDGSFLQYPTSLAVITGVDVDHLDVWGTAAAYAAGFERFATAPGVGTVVLDADNPGARHLAGILGARGCTVVTYGEGADCTVRLTQVDAPARRAVVTRGTWSATVELLQPGVHNLHNAAAALAVVAALGLDLEGALRGLAGFAGTARRFEPRGEAGGVRVVDDYAHHPVEVTATLAAARDVAGTGRVIACFQPHLFSRTRDFADAFGVALAAADACIVLDVYPAREDPIPGVTGELVAQAVARHGGQVEYHPDALDVPAAVARLARPGDLVLTLGAGTITHLGPKILRVLGDA